MRLDEDGSPLLEHAIEGDDVSDVLKFVQYDRKHLIERVRRTSVEALRRGAVPSSAWSPRR